MSDRTRTLGIGTAVGLIIGPQLGVALIKMAHVPYLETSFAFGRLALGLLAGAVLGILGASLLGDRVERMSPGSVRGLIVLGIIINIAETVFIKNNPLTAQKALGSKQYLPIRLITSPTLDILSSETGG